MSTLDPFARLDRKPAEKREALIEREGAAYVVADFGDPEFITTSEVLAVTAAHAYAHEQQEDFRSIDGKGGYYLPEIYRVPLNTEVRLHQFRFYGRGGGSWGPVGEQPPAQEKAFRAADEQRRLFAADQPAGDPVQQATAYPEDPAVAGWVWTTRNIASFWREPRIAVYTDEARAIAATKPDHALFGLYPGGRSRPSLRGRLYPIRGYFQETGQWGYRSGHGAADPRHPSHSTPNH